MKNGYNLPVKGKKCDLKLDNSEYTENYWIAHFVIEFYGMWGIFQ